MARRKRPDGRSRWRSQTSGRRFPPRAFTDQLRAPRGLGHLDNFINASDYRAGRRPRREINQFPRLVIRFRGTKRTSNENDAVNSDVREREKRGILCLRAQIT